MKTRIPTFRIALLALCLLGFTRQSHAQPVTNVYEILSGDYTACCGIAGPFHDSLPNDSQSHLWLALDVAQLTAELTILGYGDGEPVFQVIRNGRVYPDHIEFGLPIAPGQGLYQEHYIVSNSASGLRLDGLRVTPLMGADVPNRFAHSNVVARLLPGTPVKASIRVSQVEICWESISNRTYQVQFRTSFTDDWMNLNGFVFGNGGTKCVTDRVGIDQPRRFYRVVPSP